MAKEPVKKKKLRWLTPTEVGEERNLKYDSVLQLIHTRAIKAVDVRSSPSKRGRAVYRIREDWVEDFFAGRELQPVPPSTAKVMQHRIKPGDVIEFFT